MATQVCPTYDAPAGGKQIACAIVVEVIGAASTKSATSFCNVPALYAGCNNIIAICMLTTKIGIRVYESVSPLLGQIARPNGAADLDSYLRVLLAARRRRGGEQVSDAGAEADAVGVGQVDAVRAGGHEPWRHDGAAEQVLPPVCHRYLPRVLLHARDYTS